MRFAVSHIDWFDHELTIMVVHAPDWYSALKEHPKLKEFELPSTSLEDAKKEAFNCDAMVEVLEIPD